MHAGEPMAGNTENGGGRRGSRWRIAVWGTAAFLLLLPLVAMQFTDEVNWDETDFILVWMNLAVGVIGSEDDPLNLMYGGVLAVGIIGAVVARFQPDAMARAMV